MANKNLAFFVIDVQHDLAQDPDSAVPDASAIRHAIGSSLEYARSIESMRIIIVQHDDTEEGEALYPGTKGWKLVFEPEDEEEWLYRKTHGNVFESNPDLAPRLQSEGITQLVMCGVQSDCCVRASSLGAIQAGFKDISVLAGAHSTYPSNEKSLEEIKQEVEGALLGKGIRILPWQQWIATQ